VVLEHWGVGWPFASQASLELLDAAGEGSHLPRNHPVQFDCGRHVALAGSAPHAAGPDHSLHRSIAIMPSSGGKKLGGGIMRWGALRRLGIHPSYEEARRAKSSALTTPLLQSALPNSTLNGYPVRHTCLTQCWSHSSLHRGAC